MQKATVTYVAPVGDAREVTMGGVTFYDGKPVELNSYDNPHLISKLGNSNPLFDVTISKEDNQPPPKVKRGRPSNADIAAAKAAAEQAERDAKTAKEKSEAAKSDVEKMTKHSDKEITRPSAEGAKSDIKAGQSEATNHDFEKDRQEQTAKRDAQARGIGPAEDRPDNQRGQTAGQNQSNYSGQGQAGYTGGHGQATTGGQNTTPGNPPGGQGQSGPYGGPPRSDHT